MPVNACKCLVLLVLTTNAAHGFFSVPNDTLRDRADSLTRRGIQLQSEARYTDALAVFVKAGADSGSAAARFYFGLCYFGLNEFQDAVKRISSAVQLDSQNIGYRFRLALTLAQLGELSRAQENYEAILAQDPTYVPGLFNLAVMQMEQGNFSRSAELLLKVVAIRPRDFLSFYNLGICMSALGHPDSAKVCYATSMTLNQKYVPAIVNLASLHYRAQNFDESSRLFKRAFQLRPNSADFAYKIGLCFQQLQQWILAKAAFQDASKLDSSKSEYVAQLGYAYFFNRQFDSSSIAYRRAIARDSLESSYHLNLGLAYSSMNSTEAAAREFQRAIELRHPEGIAKIYDQLGGLHFRSGHLSKAIRSYQKALGLDSCDREAQFYSSITYERMGAASKAKQSFEKFLTLVSNDTTKKDWQLYARKRIREMNKRNPNR